MYLIFTAWLHCNFILADTLRPKKQVHIFDERLLILNSILEERLCFANIPQARVQAFWMSKLTVLHLLCMQGKVNT